MDLMQAISVALCMTWTAPGQSGACSEPIELFGTQVLAPPALAHPQIQAPRPPHFSVLAKRHFQIERVPPDHYWKFSQSLKEAAAQEEMFNNQFVEMADMVGFIENPRSAEIMAILVARTVEGHLAGALILYRANLRDLGSRWTLWDVVRSAFENQGASTALRQSAIRWAQLHNEDLIVSIKPYNIRSIRSFLRAATQSGIEPIVIDPQYIRYRLPLSSAA